MIPNLNRFRDFLRFDSGAASTAFKTQYPLVFDETNSFALNEQITTEDGDTLDCLANSSTCWNYIPVYFEKRLPEVEVFCGELETRRAFELETEQATLRIRLCQEGFIATCSPLDVQVNEIKGNATSCAALGLGPNGAGVRPPENPCATSENEGTDPPGAALRALGLVAVCLSMLLGLILV